MNRRAYRRSKWMRIIALLAGLVCGSACSLTRSVAEGAYVYRGARIEYGDERDLTSSVLRGELNDALEPTPNRNILGLPIPLWWYHFFYSEKEKGLIPGIRRLIGRPPVLLEENTPGRVARIMENRLFNHGHFTGGVEARLDTANKKARVIYQVSPDTAYLIRSLALNIADSTLARELRELPAPRTLKPGMPYRLSLLMDERRRMETWLKDRGYYDFDANSLEFVADSSVGRRQIDLQLQLKPGVARESLRPKTIGRITVYPDYDLASGHVAPREEYDGLTLAYQSPMLRNTLLRRLIKLRGGEPYQVTQHYATLKRLVNLNTFRFVNMRFHPAVDSDTLLDVEVLLTPRLPQNIQGQVGFTYKNTNYVGPELALTYQHWNLFRGAERLQVSAQGNFNFPLPNSFGNYFQQTILSARLSRPGLLIPFISQRERGRLLAADTKVEARWNNERLKLNLTEAVGLDYEPLAGLLRTFRFGETLDNLLADTAYAPLVAINNANVAFGYLWQRRNTIRHEFNPLRVSIQYSNFPNAEVRALLQFRSLFADVPQTVSNLERMLTFKPDYIFLFDSRLERLRRDNYFFRGRLAVASNRVYSSPQGLFDVQDRLSRFVQIESDIRYFSIPNQKNTLALRLLANVSAPLGGEIILPFLDLYTVGGPTSVRAYTLREVGPGGLPVDSAGLQFFRGRGDIQLETSLEYRYRASSMLELAAFVDAGNVWFFGEDSAGGVEAQFRLERFHRDLAVGAGLGLRFHLSILVLRLDFAAPLADPRLPLGQRWVGNRINSLSDFRFNFAFGYPF